MMSLVGLHTRLTSLPRAWKQFVVVTFDALTGLFTTWLAFCLRLGTVHIAWTWEQLFIFALAPALAIPIFLRLGLYRAIFRYSGFGAAVTVARAVTIYAVIFVVLVLLLSPPNVPRTVAVIQPVLFAWLVLALRSAGQLALRDVADSVDRKNLLIYGAGLSGIRTAASLSHSSEFQVKGFIDDDPAKVGREIMGRQVFDRSGAEMLITSKKVTVVLIALPGVSRGVRNGVLEWLRPFSVRVQSIPTTAEIVTGKVTITDLKDLDIEDLLGREANPALDADIRQEVQGQTIAVTGAGGSIGSELCRQLLQAQPAKLVLIESSEYALYAIHRELLGLIKAFDQSVELVPLLCNVQNAPRVDQIFALWKPVIVYHAAAYKHVPLVEQNVIEGVQNNTMGTLIVATAAIRHQLGKLVLISTDKAVRPTNVMGASKRFAEIVLQAIAAEKELLDEISGSFVANRTVMTMVRFGNVLGSSGSVVPMFRAQLASGGPLTVTHREVTRYFMTIPEAVELVLQAGAMARGGDLFLLDMGEPVRIYDLARRIVELSGSTVCDESNPDGDIEIKITGLRPGEKLYEELLIDDNAQPTRHPRIRRAREKMFRWSVLNEDLQKLQRALDAYDIETTRLLLMKYVDGFKGEGAVDLVELAGPGNEAAERSSDQGDKMRGEMTASYGTR